MGQIFAAIDYHKMGLYTASDRMKFCRPANYPNRGGSPLDELELVIFDMAGTTVEGRGEVPFAFTAALADYGIGVTPEQIKNVRGASKRQALRHFLPAGPEQARLANEAYAFLAHTTARRWHARPTPIFFLRWQKWPGNGQKRVESYEGISYRWYRLYRATPHSCPAWPRLGCGCARSQTR